MLKDLGGAGRRLPTMAVIATVTALLAGLVVTPAAAAPPPPKAPNATFGIGPANATGLDSRGYLNYDSSPGSRVNDRVAVHNYSSQTLKLLVYAADATEGTNGAIGYRSQATPGTDASRWISFVGGASVVNVTLGPSETRVLSIGVDVPAKAGPGDHLAAVIASLASQVVTKNGEKVTLDQRVAVRAAFRVSGAVRPELVIGGLHATYHNNFNPIGTGSVAVNYTVHNSGNVILGGPQSLKISGLFGSTGSTPVLAQIPLLLPGGSVHVSVDVRHVSPELIMHAKVTISTVGATSTVNPGIHVTNATATFWAIPWTLLVILFLLLGGAVGAVLGRRRPRRQYQPERRYQPSSALAGRA